MGVRGGADSKDSKKTWSSSLIPCGKGLYCHETFMTNGYSFMLSQKEDFALCCLLHTHLS